MSAVDYSDRAITMRLKRLSQLRKLCVSLSKAKPVSAAIPAGEQSPPAKTPQ
jgi:hypothetical protein